MPTPATCDACRHRTATRQLQQRSLCWWCFVRAPSIVRRSLLTALVVGTILTLINQSGALLDNGLTPDIAARIALTYVVPYLVATWGALGASRIAVNEASG